MLAFAVVQVHSDAPPASESDAGATNVGSAAQHSVEVSPHQHTSTTADELAEWAKLVNADGAAVLELTKRFYTHHAASMSDSCKAMVADIFGRVYSTLKEHSDDVTAARTFAGMVEAAFTNPAQNKATDCAVQQSIFVRFFEIATFAYASSPHGAQSGHNKWFRRKAAPVDPVLVAQKAMFHLYHFALKLVTPRKANDREDPPGWVTVPPPTGEKAHRGELWKFLSEYANVLGGARFKWPAPYIHKELAPPVLYLATHPKALAKYRDVVKEWPTDYTHTDLIIRGLNSVMAETPETPGQAGRIDQLASMANLANGRDYARPLYELSQKPPRDAAASTTLAYLYLLAVQYGVSKDTIPALLRIANAAPDAARDAAIAKVREEEPSLRDRKVTLKNFKVTVRSIVNGLQNGH